MHADMGNSNSTNMDFWTCGHQVWGAATGDSHIRVCYADNQVMMTSQDNHLANMGYHYSLDNHTRTQLKKSINSILGLGIVAAWYVLVKKSDVKISKSQLGY